MATTTEPSTRPNSPKSMRPSLGGDISWRVLIFLAVFVGLAIFFHLQSNGVFLTPRNISLLLRQAAVLSVLAAGVSMLMIKGEIDLSIGSAIFLCGVVSAQVTMVYGWPIGAAIAAALVAGLLIGLIQGLWVVYLGIPSFVATLAGLLAWRGAGLMWTDAATVGPVGPQFTRVSEGFLPPATSVGLIAAVAVTVVVVTLLRSHGHDGSRPRALVWLKLAGLLAVLAGLAWVVGGFQGLPLAVIWAGVVVFVLAALLASTRYGRSAYLLGANREAARYAGISVRRMLMRGFLLMGLIYGIGGVLLTARIGASTPGAGQFMELDAIAAAVIGGVSLRGGIGTPLGALVGALLLTTINNGMSILNISSFAQLVIKGLILVAALALDSFANRRATR